MAENRTDTTMAMAGVAVAFAAVVVTVIVAVAQARQTRQALFESRLQQRAATCYAAAAHYTDQAFRFSAVADFDYALHHVDPPDEGESDVYEGAPNQLLQHYGEAALRTGRAIQLCLNKGGSRSLVEDCLRENVNISAHEVIDNAGGQDETRNLVC